MKNIIVNNKKYTKLTIEIILKYDWAYPRVGVEKCPFTLGQLSGRGYMMPKNRSLHNLKKLLYWMNTLGFGTIDPGNSVSDYYSFIKREYKNTMIRVLNYILFKISIPHTKVYENEIYNNDVKKTYLIPKRRENIIKKLGVDYVPEGTYLGMRPKVFSNYLVYRVKNVRV